ncbi:MULTISPECIES: TetR/AcrR family transcriptional regulator [unclassified Rathayibacter]|uniref:TetR/AcrR family transcriptional regulator n=1 Tax=unclassified Rathayibacter TaxID=2609250 RepID=UPI000F4CD809|nr:MULTISPECIES: TetR/AcrR family transcriptional regulator [unclassified Rathayibacter]
MTSSPRRQPGRKLDRSRDGVILDAALAVMAEVGYEAATVDAVAARAGAARATVYRRWPTKTALAAAAVAHLTAADAGSTDLPDLGSLRDDLLATTVTMSEAEQQLRIDVMSTLADAGRTDPALASLTASASADPWVEVSRSLLRRAIDRGEFPPGDIDTLAMVIPTLCVHRTAVQRTPVTREFVADLIDHVVVPALRGRR